MSNNPIDLSQLPAPSVVEALDYETILSEMLDDLRARDEQFDALVESDPAYKILQVAAYRELIVRQRVNEASRSVMLAYATGTDLDQLAALFGVQRLIIAPGDPEAIPPIDAVLESDREFRRRIQLSLEGFSTAGPEGAYVYHALSADGAVLDASAVSPAPGEVVVTVLDRNGDGWADQTLVEAVEAAVSAETVRPLTDHVTVQSAQIVPYRIRATLYMFDGPDSTVVMDNARAAVQQYADDNHRLGRDITLSGIYAALHQPGAQRVELAEPTKTLLIDRQSASWCTGIELNTGDVISD